MRTGDYVQKRRFKGSLGVITERPPIYGCWKVKWTRGGEQGRVTLIQEDNLTLATIKS